MQQLHAVLVWQVQPRACFVTSHGTSTSDMHHSIHGVGTMMRELKKIINCCQLKKLPPLVQL